MNFRPISNLEDHENEKGENTNLERSPAWHSCGSLVQRACPGFADTEGVGVTQYPLMHKQSGEVPWIQQADGGKLAHVTLSGSPDSAA